MKIAIVQPPVRDFYQTPHRHAALGCFTVKSLLEQAGHRVKLFNFPLEGGKSSTPPLPKDLSYLKPFLIPGESGPVSWFNQRKHFGPSFEECSRILREWKPERILISCFAWCYAGETRQLAELLRKDAPEIPLEAGGAGVSVNPLWFDRTGLFDRVRTGPAEENLKDFPGMPADIPPITSVINRVADFRGRPQFTTMLTRGCPCRCSFCANYLTLGREFRKSKPETILDLLKQTGLTDFHLNMEDDNLLADREYFLKFLHSFHKMFPRATLSAENGLDYQMLPLPLAEELIRCGFSRFNLSMASADSTILADQKRSSRLDHLQELLALLEKRNIPAVCYFICGLKGDSLESVIGNILFLAEQPAEIGISPFYAVPGLPGFERPGERGLPEYPALYCGSSVYPWNGNLTTAQLITAFRLCRLINLIKSPGAEEWKELIDKTFETGRLQTIVRKKNKKTIREVPLMDDQVLAGAVLEGIKRA